MDFQTTSTTEASVKTYLLDTENKVTEIRRFALPCPPRVVHLIDKARTLYGIDSSQQVRVQWLDPECDRVTFSTDEELADALRSIGGGGGDATLRVYVSQPTDLVSADSNGVVHPFVVCDGCEEGPLRGYRFKCAICPDFDLCCHCVMLDRHSEHPMILVRRPRDPFISRLNKWLNRSYLMRRFRPDNPGDNCGGSSGTGSLPSDCVRILRELEAAAVKVVQHQQQQQPLQSSGMQSQQAMMCPFSETSLEVESPLRCGSESSLQVGGNEVVCSSQEQMLRFVHSMSNSLNALLQPLGVEVSYHTTAQASPTGRRQQQQQKQQQRQQQQQCQQSDSAMVVEDTVASASASAAATTAAGAEIKLPAAAHQSPLPEHVAKALDQMQAMGFTDDAGLLTELLVSANGDISRVLDALRQS